MWHCRCTPRSPREVAEARQVEADDVAEVGRIGDEALDAVVRRGGVGRARSSQLARFTVPVVGHRRIVARLGPPCFAARPALLEAAVA